MPRDWDYVGGETVDEVVIVVDGSDGSVSIDPPVGSGRLFDSERLIGDLSWDGVSLSMYGTAGDHGLHLLGIDSSGRTVLEEEVQPHENFWLPAQVGIPDGPSSARGYEAGPFFDVVASGLHTLTISADKSLNGLSIKVRAGQYRPREFEAVLDRASCLNVVQAEATGHLVNMTDDAHSYRVFVQFGPVGEQEYQVALVEDLQPGETVHWRTPPAMHSYYDYCGISEVEVDEFWNGDCSQYHIEWCPEPKPPS